MCVVEKFIVTRQITYQTCNKEDRMQVRACKARRVIMEEISSVSNTDLIVLNNANVSIDKRHIEWQVKTNVLSNSGLYQMML